MFDTFTQKFPRDYTAAYTIYTNPYLEGKPLKSVPS